MIWLLAVHSIITGMAKLFSWKIHITLQLFNEQWSNYFVNDFHSLICMIVFTSLWRQRLGVMLRSIELVNSWSRVHERWNSVPFISWTRELVITSGELELGSCTSSSPLVIKDGGGSWYGRWIFGCKSIFLQYFNRIQQCFGSLTILDCHYRT